MSSFIWGIEISGIEIDENTVHNLYENGLKIGMLKNMVDVDAVRSKMMTNMPEIAWIGINIIGSKAEVEIKERIQKPDIVEKDKPYNIKAKCDGVITRIEVKQGMPLVKQGDVVTKGQLLVSGVLESSVVGVRLVPSSAIILAKTWHEKSILGYTETQKRRGR